MKILVSTAVLLLAGSANAQTPPPAQPAPPTSSLTRDLNSGPPAPATYLAPAPAPVTAVEPEAAPATPPPAATATPEPRPVPTPTQPPSTSAPPTPVLPPSQPFTPPPGVMRPRLTPIPTDPAPAPRMVPITPPAGSAVTAPSPRPSEPFTPPGTARPPAPSVPLEELAPAPPAAPAITVLDSAARAALPFTADLPPGFEIVTGRPGPDFRIYTIRRGGQSFVMVYTGPASQFPIYSGQMVEAGGRASILSNVDGTRRAVEHLFQRSATPAEIHIWTMSLDGAERDLAEQIAQSVDVR